MPSVARLSICGCCNASRCVTAFSTASLFRKVGKSSALRLFFVVVDDTIEVMEEGAIRVRFVCPLFVSGEALNVEASSSEG